VTLSMRIEHTRRLVHLSEAVLRAVPRLDPLGVGVVVHALAFDRNLAVDDLVKVDLFLLIARVVGLGFELLADMNFFVAE